eukprot:757088-Hanusia_phi.AAC.8
MSRVFPSTGQIGETSLFNSELILFAFSRLARMICLWINLMEQVSTDHWLNKGSPIRPSLMRMREREDGESEIPATYSM